MLPNNREYEYQMLGMFITSAQHQDFIAHVTDDFFYQEWHKEVFRTIKSMYEQGIIIDLLTVSTEMKGHNYELAKMTHSYAGYQNCEYYLRILEQLMRQRKYLEYCHKVVNDPKYLDMDFGDMVDENTSVMAEIMDLKNWRAHHMSDVTERTLEALKTKEVENSTGWGRLDRLMGGLKRQDLILIAGRPSMGKTALGLCMAMSHEMSGGKPAFISLEMPKDAIAKRRLGMIGGIEASRVFNHDLSDFEIEQLGVHSIEQPTKMLIDDTPGMDIYAVGAKIKQMVRHDKITAVFLDYIQLIKFTAHGKQVNKEQEIGKISTGLKQLARQLNIPIVAMAQLSREVEKRGDKRPQLSDLRDSGQLEQDADVVMFPYRPKYYERKDANPDATFEEQERCELIIAKNRNGKTGTLGGENADIFIFDPPRIQYIFK